MNIVLQEVSIRELTSGYKDNDEEGVIGYGGKLDVRPPYQREFIYKDAQRDAVIETVIKNFPLNVMYWAVRPDGGYELIDGQQRTISICQFIDGDFAYKNRYFHNLTNDEKDLILNYKLMIYQCSGPESEKLDWFKTINIAGERLTEQELRNAVYTGSWVSDAKRYFSKNSCPAHNLAGDYMSGSAIRQDYLETVISWKNNGDIEGYMALNQHKPNANELWLYFQSVIAWTTTSFPKYRREMKGLAWGDLFNQFHSLDLDSSKLENQISTLMADEDVTNKRGIYAYVLSGHEKHLNIRTFSDNQKRESYERQNGRCPVCKNHFELNEMEADHITPWRAGGKTDSENCQMLCKEDNRRKGGV
jgi:hypothetical protein